MPGRDNNKNNRRVVKMNYNEKQNDCIWKLIRKIQRGKADLPCAKCYWCDNGDEGCPNYMDNAIYQTISIDIQGREITSKRWENEI